MGHSIAGFVGQLGHVQQLAARRPGLTVAPLAQGFGLAVEDGGGYGVSTGPAEADAAVCTAIGATMPLAFVATSYFGGEGDQGACVWAGDRSRPWRVASGEVVSDALRALGVGRTAECRDEFEAVGLGWYRDVGDWIAFARSGKAVWERAAQPAAAEAFRALGSRRG